MAWPISELGPPVQFQGDRKPHWWPCASAVMSARPTPFSALFRPAPVNRAPQGTVSSSGRNGPTGQGLCWEEASAFACVFWEKLVGVLWDFGDTEASDSQA